MNVLKVDADGNEIHAELKTNGVNISIFSTKGMENMAPFSMQGAGHGGFTLGFEVDDLESEFQRLKAMGVEFLMYPTTHPWGYRSFWFRDPDSNIIDFFTKQSM
jgi:uncharacterized glyoxalase superfamily protein PhnB